MNEMISVRSLVLFCKNRVFFDFCSANRLMSSRLHEPRYKKLVFGMGAERSSPPSRCVHQSCQIGLDRVEPNYEKNTDRGKPECQT